MTFSTDLTDAQRERLALVAEEMGEVIHVIGKTLRHGYESPHPTTRIRNRAALARELGDVLFCVDLLLANDDIDGDYIKSAYQEKQRNIAQWVHFPHRWP